MTGPAAGAPLDLSAIARIVDAGDASTDACRAALEAGREAVHLAFEAGVPASALLAGRTAVVDLVLTRLWYRAGAAFDGLSLLAVGGYGRGELQPASDVDIAVLLPDAPEPDGPPADGHAAAARDEAIATWIRNLWDLGLDLGHSVRTVTGSAAAARDELSTITNLMEARLVAGASAPFAAVRAATSAARMWPADEFLGAKLAERSARLARVGTNPYRLEPNIKETEGGLRDFQTIVWICQRRFGRARAGICGGPEELGPLVDHDILEPRELGRLAEGLELLWRIRYLLHHFAGREEDRLLFDWQKRIAHALGHPEAANGNADIEALMQRFYRTLAGLQRLVDMSLQGLEGIIRPGPADAPAEPLAVDARFQLRNGYLETVHDDVFLHYPGALIELFLAFGRTPEALGIRSPTVRLIRRHLKLVNDRFRSDPKVRASFVEVFRLQDRLVRTLRLMYRHGVLAAYLPAFDAIVGRMQYDLFHQYTVDEHTMLVVRNLRRFFVARFDDEYPHCSEIARTVKRPYALYLTALFHDIAKGRGGDHSELGAVDMHEFAVSHALPAHDAALCTWLVRHHLEMSMTAQRRDIDDPEVQLDFARLVGTPERLDHLYLLTVADIRATDPKLYNSFRSSLLRALYRHARGLLERGLDDAPVADQVILARQSRTRALLAPALAADPRVDALWARLGEDWFRHHQAPELARHTEALLAHEAAAATRGADDPLVALRHSPGRGSVELLIRTADDVALFALITTVLEALDLDVLSAVVHTTADGHALDAFDVLEADGSLIEGERRIEEIRCALLAGLAAPATLPALVERRASRRLKHFRTATDVDIAPRADGPTELRIVTADRPGILSAIGRQLLAAGVAVHGARIATLGERVEDVFFVTAADGRPWHDPTAHARLTRTLCERLS